MKPIAREPSLKQILGALMMTGAAATAQGAGFAIIEQSASGMGNAYAGAAASAEDASTVFFNPAGLTRLSQRQLVVAGHVIRPSSEFSNDGSTDVLGTPIATGGNGGDAGGATLVPNFYYSMPVKQDLVFGIGVNAPFGLKTEYDDNWVGRYHAIKSELKTVNINPSLAWKMNDRLSFGAGVNAQYIEAELTQAVDAGGLCYASVISQQLALGASQAAATAAAQTTCATNLGLSPQTNDGNARVDGDDWSYGYNLGVLYEPMDTTRFGFQYRSKIGHTLRGSADFSIPAGFSAFLTAAGSPNFTDTGASADIDLPETASLSAYHEANETWTLLADITWTRWSRFEELRVSYDSGQADSVVNENWENVMRYSLGVNYRYDDRWLLRAGFAFDEEPIPDAAHRTPRIPGNDRRWLAFGASYSPDHAMRVDVGYAHLFVSDTPINHTSSTAGTITGSYDNSVDILSAQLVWNM